MSEAAAPAPAPPTDGPPRSRAGLTLALLGIGALSGSLLALGVGRPPRRPDPALEALREEARFPGRAYFLEHKCVVCHGTDGTGGEMGPGLGAVVAEYLAAAGGDREAALARLVQYLKEPQKVPTLRRDGTKYPNPMPSAQGLGLEDEERLRKVAEFVLGMKPARTAVGGDASDR